MLKRHKRKIVAEINVVPYIDVMLVLLVIFMVTAPILFQGVSVNLPQSSAKAVTTKKLEPLVVSVNANGDYYLNIAANPTQAISESNLLKVATIELKKAPGSEVRQVLVKGDKDVSYGKIMQAMILLQQAGAETVGLITKPTEKINNHL
jgi:biopolymer transport protein TolR